MSCRHCIMAHVFEPCNYKNSVVNKHFEHFFPQPSAALDSSKNLVLLHFHDDRSMSMYFHLFFIKHLGWFIFRKPEGNTSISASHLFLVDGRICCEKAVSLLTEKLELCHMVTSDKVCNVSLANSGWAPVAEFHPQTHLQIRAAQI